MEGVLLGIRWYQSKATYKVYAFNCAICFSMEHIYSFDWMMAEINKLMKYLDCDLIIAQPKIFGFLK
jgi:hypothetical protein